MAPRGKALYWDPDIRELLRDGGVTNPYEAMLDHVRRLLARLTHFDSSGVKPLERMFILASLAGLEVRPMDSATAGQHKGDALLVPAQSLGKKGTVLFNPSRPEPRIIHSIAHEIAHSFFPATSTGSHFRSNCRDGSPQGRELEQLCDFAAAELTMPQAEFREAVRATGFGMRYVDEIRARFGTSFEAALYRMATTAPFPAAAGLACFRTRQGQRNTPSVVTGNGDGRKYRRQSFHRSETYPDAFVLPWNKSFPEESCIYKAAKTGNLQHAQEIIPTGSGQVIHCAIDALRAPYQRPESDRFWPDALFLFKVQWAD